MGRYNFRAQKVHAVTKQLLQIGHLERRPPWFEIAGKVPPPELLVRPRPLEHSAGRLPAATAPSTTRRTKRASKMFFRPREIRYEEDRLRRRFFRDHPWELARPRIVVEDDGINGTEQWDSIRQPGRAMDGESVVQRQMHLMQHTGLTETQAYDQARTEFYDERLREDVERRVAREEATHTGAFFGKNRLQIGMELENKAFEEWRAWADVQVTALEQRRMSGTTVTQEAEGTAVDPTLDEPEMDTELEQGVEASDRSGKVVREASRARGGAMAHP